MLKTIIDRVVRNWATSSVAIIAMGVIIGSWFGFKTSSQEIAIVVVGIQTLVLLFAKD